ncbi:hypothetical protein [Mycoplasmopsis lipofaciens]|uniref:hypothetical protein n=1 Tax=Mycoplasmopsis lipofaciens TaxID=114884 RepID=UPI00047F5EE1|nr:hypothetical protein [Mycoplasmopsis lipofaciens]
MWIIFIVLMITTIIFSSVTTFSSSLTTNNAKLTLSIIGFLFFLSLVAAVLSTVIVGYIEKKAKTERGGR